MADNGALTVILSITDDFVHISQISAEIRTGKRSGTADDALATVTCGKYYQPANCTCTPRENCDGAWLRSTSNGLQCVAWNKLDSPGTIVSIYTAEFYSVPRL